MKKFFSEFKTFISRGNVMDLAVGMIIGSAFTAIVTALTNGILKPLINWVIYLICGGKGTESMYTFLVTATTTEEVNGVATEVIDLANSIYIDWGAFISAIVNFLLIAFVLFLIIKAFNKAKEESEKLKNLKKEEAAEEEEKQE